MNIKKNIVLVKSAKIDVKMTQIEVWKLTSLTSKVSFWRQISWRVRLDIIWRLCCLLTFYDVYWLFLTNFIFWKIRKKNYAVFWLVRQISWRYLTSYDVNWRHWCHMTSLNVNNNRILYFDKIKIFHNEYYLFFFFKFTND